MGIDHRFTYFADYSIQINIHMSLRLLSALSVIAILAFGSCNQKSDQEAKIKALEDKIAALESSSPSAVTPVNVQATQAADPSSLGSFQFSEMEHSFGTIQEGEVVEHTFNFTKTLSCKFMISRSHWMTDYLQPQAGAPFLAHPLIILSQKFGLQWLQKF